MQWSGTQEREHGLGFLGQNSEVCRAQLRPLALGGAGWGSWLGDRRQQSEEIEKKQIFILGGGCGRWDQTKLVLHSSLCVILT